jgi:hypothetical protein
MLTRTRTLCSQLILSTILLGCTTSDFEDFRWWHTKKAEIDLATVSDPSQYQRDYAECYSWSSAHVQGHANIATDTGKGIIQSGTTNYAINSIFPDPTLAMSTTVISGAAAGAIGGFMWSSWTSNFKINFYTAKCLIGRGYILLDHEWWDKKAETRFSGIL